MRHNQHDQLVTTKCYSSSSHIIKHFCKIVLNFFFNRRPKQCLKHLSVTSLSSRSIYTVHCFIITVNANAGCQIALEESILRLELNPTEPVFIPR